MFENLTDKLERSFKILKGEGRITEINVAETLKEIRRALIDADVNYKVAKTFTDTVKQKALGQDVLKSVKPGQMLTKIVRDELAQLMGGTATDIRLEGTPAVILIAGLQGSGKTTFSGKLAAYIKSKKGRQVLLVAGDVYRPAAIDQLKVLGSQIGVEVYTEEGNKNPVEIAQNAIKYARQHAFNVVIVDTAGRLAVDEAMMQEITAIKAAVKPSETLFVVDAMTGQDAVNTAREFNERLDFDGVVLTKLDGDTRGGAAISIRSVVDKPLKFISSGEKMDTLQVFHPERMADRILGMGDVVSLVERAQEQFDEEQARRLKKKLVKDQFNFNDFIAQIQQTADQEDGQPEGPRLDDPGHGQDAQERRHSGRRLQADRGDHLVDDACRTRAPRDHQRPAPRTHRQGLGYDDGRREPADEAVRGYAQDDEGRGGRRHEDAQDAGRFPPALTPTCEKEQGRASAAGGGSPFSLPAGFLCRLPQKAATLPSADEHSLPRKSSELFFPCRQALPARRSAILPFAGGPFPSGASPPQGGPDGKNRR